MQVYGLINWFLWGFGLLILILLSIGAVIIYFTARGLSNRLCSHCGKSAGPEYYLVAGNVMCKQCWEKL